MKPTDHAVGRSVERHGVNGKKRNRRKNVAAAVRFAMEHGVVAPDPAHPWEAEVMHPDGRRWMVDLHTKCVITALPKLDTNRKEKR